MLRPAFVNGSGLWFTATRVVAFARRWLPKRSAPAVPPPVELVTRWSDRDREAMTALALACTMAHAAPSKRPDPLELMRESDKRHRIKEEHVQVEMVLEQKGSGKKGYNGGLSMVIFSIRGSGAKAPCISSCSFVE